MGQQLAGGVEHRAFAEGQRGAAVQQLADAARQRPCAGRMKLVFISMVTTPRGSGPSSALRGAARGMRHGHVEQRHHHAAMGHVPGVVELVAHVERDLGSRRPRSAAVPAPSRSTKGMWRANCIGRRHQPPPCTQLTPPSTARICPVMCLPAADANSSAAPFRSSSSPMRLQRRLRGQLVGAELGEHALGHLAREEARRQRVDGDAVGAPLARQRAREVDHRALAGAVGDELDVEPSRASPAIDAMLMMRPWRRGIMLALPTAWLNRKMLRMFRFITLSQASSG